MTDAAHTNFFHRLRNTPLRDALRGRMSARLDWRARLAAAGLAGPACELIARVVKHTRLWRTEKAAVADELIAHFRDARAADQSIESVIAEFGAERKAARLIRRAKIRNRPLIWHVIRWLRYGAMLVVILYSKLIFDFYCAHPVPSMDYVAELNRPVENVPESDRAWPLYRQAILAMSEEQPNHPNAQRALLGRDLIYYNVDGKRWPNIEAFVRAHAGDIETLRQATAKPSMGYVLGPDGDIADPVLDPSEAKSRKREWADCPSLSGILLPYLSYTYSLASILQADAKLAQIEHDGDRLERDIDALLSMASQLRTMGDFGPDQSASIHAYSIALDVIQRILLVDPVILRDEQLTRLAHRISAPQSAADLMTLRGERLTFYDNVANVYTDNGSGSGHVTLAGLQFLNGVFARSGDEDYIDAKVAGAAGPVIAAIATSRKEVLAAFDRLMDIQEANLRIPLRDVNVQQVVTMWNDLHDPRLSKMRYANINDLIPLAIHQQGNAERYLGRRDGVVTAMALELYRRRHRGYPSQLSDLAPQFLLAVPLDRITGDPIKYKLSRGNPLLYSVGEDRIDDGGVIGKSQLKYPSDAEAAVANWPLNAKIVLGDWILYPVPSPQDQDEQP